MPLQQGDSRADWVTLFACSTACIHRSHSHERLFMRDVRQCWLDVTRLLLHHRRTSLKEVEDVLIHTRGFTKGCPCRSTDGSPTSPNWTPGGKRWSFPPTQVLNLVPVLCWIFIISNLNESTRMLTNAAGSPQRFSDVTANAEMKKTDENAKGNRWLWHRSAVFKQMQLRY